MDENKIAQKIVKVFSAEIKDINEKDFSITATVSTNKEDRYGDIVEPESFKKRLKNYKAHPVLLSSHDYGDLRKQLGEASNIKITDIGLDINFKYYANLGNAEADWAWVLAQKKIAAFSIGFMSFEFEWIKDKDKESGAEFITGRRFKDIELLEVSQVLVPANRQSLQERAAYEAEAGKLMELATKAFNAGEIKDPLSMKKEIEEGYSFSCPACGDGYAVEKGVETFTCECGTICIKRKDKPDDNNEKSHYSESILDDGPAKEAKSQSQEDVLKGVVKETAKSVFQ